MQEVQKYRLRQAGGMYWLLDVSQPGVPYKEPIALNEVGADIWKLLQEGYSEEKIIYQISTEYGVHSEIAAQDVKDFFEELKKRKIL